MRAALLGVYHRLPPSARSVAASLRGAYLRSWRYGPETADWVSEALERESWSADQWRSWREDRLARLLNRAATRVPFYREQWSRRRRRGDRSSWEVLENWPVLPKETLRVRAAEFLAEDRDPRAMSREQTSGTTGTPLTILVPREALRRHYALFEARIRLWHGVSREEPWAILGGQLVVPASRKTPPYWVVNQAMKQLYLSTHHLSPSSAAAYLEALERHAASHLIAYPSSAAVLAGAVLDQDLPAPRLQVVVSNAEELGEETRRLIGEALACPVRNTYGMAEMVAAASECRAGSMHLWPEEGVLEVLADAGDVPAGEDETGRFVATGLLNFDFPIVRYATGDRGRLPAAAVPCGCGRRLPLLAAVEGRSQDSIVTRDGRRIFWLNPVFYGLPVRQAQIVQESLDSVRVCVVPDARFEPGGPRAIVARLRDRIGDGVEVRVETVAEIGRTSAGKVRPVVSLVTNGGGARA